MLDVWKQGFGDESPVGVENEEMCVEKDESRMRQKGTEKYTNKKRNILEKFCSLKQDVIRGKRSCVTLFEYFSIKKLSGCIL